VATPSLAPFQAPAMGKRTLPASRTRSIDGAPIDEYISFGSTMSGKPLPAQPTTNTKGNNRIGQYRTPDYPNKRLISLTLGDTTLPYINSH
jgi:hypothetical protein